MSIMLMDPTLCLCFSFLVKYSMDLIRKLMRDKSNMYIMCSGWSRYFDVMAGCTIFSVI